MPVRVNEQVYYRTAKVCQAAGIGEDTLRRCIGQVQEYVPGMKLIEETK